MKTASPVAKRSSTQTPWSPPRSGVLQRQCACGGNPGPGGECAECRRRHRLAEGSLLQPRLKIGRTDDPLEREADRVAEQVMRMPEPAVQRQPEAEHEEEEDELLRPKPLIQRWVTVSEPGLTEAPPIVHEVLRSPGQPLDPATRAFMESRFGHDFSQVRVHTDEQAAKSARAVQALAYTVGNHVVFGARQYRPGTEAGQRVLAHELVHTIQQRGAGPGPGAAVQRPGRSGQFLARQCDPAWTRLDWSDRVNNAKAMANGAAKFQCLTDMIAEALYPNITVYQCTNAASSVNAAIAAGHYVELGTLSNPRVNFDNNLTAKTQDPNLYGYTVFQQPTSNVNDIDIYIILSPNALNPIGPQFTRMAFDHEASHARDFLFQFATGAPHAATAGEELSIYAQLFSQYFLDMWSIDSTACTWNLAEGFLPLFSYYASAAAAERDSAFDSIRSFYDVHINGNNCNMMKFKIWLQLVMNALPDSDVLVTRINGLPGLGLSRGTAPNTHFNCELGCT